MFVERKVNPTTHIVELWRCEWENHAGAPAKKVYLGKLGDEQLARQDPDAEATEQHAICWSYGRTLGNIAVFSPSLLGRFPGTAGDDAELPCDFVHAGKFRMGTERWWCRTHQTHWGAKADLRAFDQFGEMRCANHAQRMHYIVGPLTLNLRDYEEVGIWCSMPAGLSTFEVKNRAPRIHVHVRPKANGKKIIDRDFDAISVRYSPDLGLFESDDINRVNITPPAAFEFVRSLESGREMSCIGCSNCGYPHLDLGDFARTPHRKHFCGNCGRDSTWSSDPIVSTPLKPLHDTFAKTVKYTTPERTLDLDEYPGCNFTVWASTPAIVWTAARPQEFGIHVHVYRGPERFIDDTFGEVIRDGKRLDRQTLIASMISRSIA
jgi:hypothetical protein